MLEVEPIALRQRGRQRGRMATGNESVAGAT